MRRATQLVTDHSWRPSPTYFAGTWTILAWDFRRDMTYTVLSCAGNGEQEVRGA